MSILKFQNGYLFLVFYLVMFSLNCESQKRYIFLLSNNQNLENYFVLILFLIY
jgi:hypothetical protein